MTGPYDGSERRAIVIECVRRSGLRRAYVQMIMTRGRPPVGSRDPRECVNAFYVFCIPYVWIATPEVKARGLHLHVSDRWRIPPESVDPTLKHYHWLEFEMGLFDAYDRGAETVALRDRHGGGDGRAGVQPVPGGRRRVVHARRRRARRHDPAHCDGVVRRDGYSMPSGAHRQ